MNKKIWLGIYLASFTVFLFALFFLLAGLLIQIDGVLMRFDDNVMVIALVVDENGSGG